MTASTDAKFFATKTGVPHVLSAATMDGKCATAQARWTALGADVATFTGLSPEAVIDLDKDCAKCGAVALAKSFAVTPAKRRTTAKATADETRAKAAGKKTTVTKPVAAKTKPKAGKPAASLKTPKLDADGRNKSKAQSMADAINAAKSGWKATVENGGPRVTVTAKKGDWVLVTTFVDGKLDLENMPVLKVGEWRGILRNVSAVLIQTDAKTSDVPKPFPNPGSGRAKRLREDEVEPTNDGPELAGLDDKAILARVTGKTISWRNTQAKVTESAKVPAKSKMTVIKEHPKTGAKMLDFAPVEDVVDGVEVLGGLRTVLVAKISNVA